MKHILKRTVISFLTFSLVVIGVTYVHSTTVKKTNVAKLINLSDFILVGKVVSVTDGFDGNNLPFTEVTVEVSEAVRGNVSVNYTFRQFGLLAPRDLGNGKTYVGVSPDGWPKFRVGEEVMLFLPQPSSIGLCTTIGLFQGKFNIANGQLVNEIDNMGLFEDVSVDPGSLSEAEEKMLQMKKGKIPAETFTSFVRKAVENNWFN